MTKKTQRRLLIILPLCAVLIGAVALAGFYIGRTADMDGMQAGVYEGMPYRIYVPEGAQGELPLVLYLHGAGRRGNDNRAQIKDNSFLQALRSEENLAAYPCILLVPQCPKNQGWVSSQDEDFSRNTAALMGLLEQVKADYPVDPARVYITGNSMGGFGTWGMLLAYPDYFAAAVPICGGWLRDDDPAHAPLYKDVPIWAFHGDQDTAVPVERTRDMVEALKAVGGNIKYTEYPGEGHGISERAYHEPELLPWLFAQSRDQE